MLKKRTICLLVLGIFVGSLEADIVSINSFDQFNKSINQQNIVVKFFAHWCGPCRASHRIFERLSNDEAYKDVTFIEVNVDDGQKIANKYKIRGIPAFIFIKNGVVTGKVVGYDQDTEKALTKELNKFIESEKKVESEIQKGA